MFDKSQTIITADFLLFFLSDLRCVISDFLHKIFFLFQTALQSVCFFRSVRFFFAALPKIFGNKKGCNLVSVKILYCNRAYFFSKRRFAFPRSPARRYFVCNKVPWLCVTASRRFCRQVFSYFKGKFTSDLSSIPLFTTLIIHNEKPLVKRFFNLLSISHNFQNSYFRSVP